MIKAPFNFVPLNKNIYFPEWADEISQEVPFQDGISGTVKINIKAESPIIVSEDGTHFCAVVDSAGLKQYFIPGSSIKGAIRNVMEILSFGKMSFVQNQVFTIRDLYRGKKKNDDESIQSDGDFYLNKLSTENIHCGWMSIQANSCYIDDCGKPWRISAQRIDELLEEKNLQMDFGNLSSLESFVRNGDYSSKAETNRYAKTKYEALRMALDYTDDRFYQRGGLSKLFESLTTCFIDDNETTSEINAGGRVFKRVGGAGRRGTVVFTGQPGGRKYDEREAKWTGKYFEFVFPCEPQAENIHVPDDVFRSFESIHKNSPDYKDFLRARLLNGEKIPVFFVYTDDQETEIDAIGISYMFRYPAFNSVYNGIKPLSLLDENRHDLVDCIFGYTGKKESLKGRVQFSNAFAKGNPRMVRLNYALSSPHPSYYPLYLGNGMSWNSEIVRIAGRKRYPIKNVQEGNLGSKAMNRPVEALGSGTEFICNIHFFNLKDIELGALLCALDFCGREACRHSLGQGKPLGYGKIKITISDMKYGPHSNSIDVTTAKDAFIDKMNEESIENRWEGRWEDSVQLRELFAMAEGIPEGRDNEFSYMQMSVKKENGKKENQFVTAKKAYKDDNEQLGLFTQIIENQVPRSTIQDMASLNAKRLDVEAFISCRDRVLEIVESGELPDNIVSEELIRMKDILIDCQEQFAENLDEILKVYSEMLKPLEEVLLQKKAAEEEERKEKSEREKAEEHERIEREKAEKLRIKAEEKLNKAKAKSDWKKQEQQNVRKESAELPTSPTSQATSLCEQLTKAPSVGQLTKMIGNTFKNEGRNQLKPEELNALTDGVRSVIKSLSVKMNKKELESRGAWQANGSIWEKVADLVGIEAFASAFPVFDKDNE